MTLAQSRKIAQLLPVLKAARLRCLDCSAQNPYEVENCVCPDCPLYPFRSGTLNFTRGKSQEVAENE